MDDAGIDFEKIVFQILVKEKDRNDSFLKKEDIEILLSGDKEREHELRAGCVGYPAYPLYKEISSVLSYWLETRHCIVLDLPVYELFDEQGYENIRMEYVKNIGALLESLKSLWPLWSDDERFYRIRDILKTLGKRGMMDLLGVRKTVGTCEMFPPSRELLEDTFNAKHNVNSQLTVGARALAKHCHRDQSASWWGKCTGTELAKNDHSQNILDKILDGATWINIHQLPHQVEIIEVRQIDGYGARWSADGLTFRGFLEPQMAEGWTCGYRH